MTFREAAFYVHYIRANGCVILHDRVKWLEPVRHRMACRRLADLRMEDARRQREQRRKQHEEYVAALEKSRPAIEAFYLELANHERIV